MWVMQGLLDISLKENMPAATIPTNMVPTTIICFLFILFGLALSPRYARCGIN